MCEILLLRECHRIISVFDCDIGSGDDVNDAAKKNIEKWNYGKVRADEAHRQYFRSN